MLKKILIADDSQTVITILKDIFEKEGYVVATAGSGEEALSVLEFQQPDVVLTDTVMTGMDGFEVCRRIKENPSMAKPPKVVVMTGIDGFEVCRRIKGNSSLAKPPKVIVMTGSVEAVDATKARSVGADDYCAKTSDFTYILNTVNELLV